MCDFVTIVDLLIGKLRSVKLILIVATSLQTLPRVLTRFLSFTA